MFLHKLHNPVHQVKIALVGKYVELADAYKSISESFVHAGVANEAHVDLKYIQSEDITETNYKELLGCLRRYPCGTRVWLKRH